MQAAEKDFLTLMSELARDSNGTDFTLICEGVSRQTHSFILRELIYLTITLFNVVLPISLSQEQVTIL